MPLYTSQPCTIFTLRLSSLLFLPAMWCRRRASPRAASTADRDDDGAESGPQNRTAAQALAPLERLVGAEDGDGVAARDVAEPARDRGGGDDGLQRGDARAHLPLGREAGEQRERRVFARRARQGRRRRRPGGRARPAAARGRRRRARGSCRNVLALLTAVGCTCALGSEKSQCTARQRLGRRQRRA